MVRSPFRHIARKPVVGTAAIDWSSPLSRGLVVGMTLTEGAGSYVHNLARRLNPAGASDPAWSVHPVGGQGFAAKAVTSRFLLVPHETELDVLGDLTIVTRVTVTSTAGEQNLAFKGSGSFEFDISGTSLRFNKAAFAVIASATIAASNNVRHFAATMTANDAVKIYIDGLQAATGSGTTLADTSNDLLVAGVSGTKVLSDMMFEFWLWNRPLSPQDIWKTYKEPYTLLRPFTRTIWADAPAAAVGGITRQMLIQHG